jgi:hypothetical protein
MKLKISGGFNNDNFISDSRFIGLNDEKEIGDRDPLDYLVRFCNQRMREFRQPVTFRVSGYVTKFWSTGIRQTRYIIEIEYIPMEWYLGYTKETYIGRLI